MYHSHDGYHSNIREWTVEIPTKSNLYRWADGIIGSPRKFITISWDGKKDDIVRFNDIDYINRIREDINKFVEINRVRICDTGYSGDYLRIEVYYSDDYYETLYISPSNEIYLNDEKIEIKKNTKSCYVIYNFVKFLRRNVYSDSDEDSDNDKDSDSDKNI